MTNAEYEKLIKAASAKLGASPDSLKSALNKGDISSLAAGLSASDRQKLKAVLGNKQLMGRLKNASPEEIMKLLGAK